MGKIIRSGKNKVKTGKDKNKRGIMFDLKPKELAASKKFAVIPEFKGKKIK